MTSSATSAGATAAAFVLPEPATGRSITLNDYSGQPLLIVFMCNHCPYVIHVLDGLIRASRELERLGIATLGINANDVTSYPSDSPENMTRLVNQHAIPFPYLYDKTQVVARAYQAVCTPDLYLFDSSHSLFYRGQFDASRPGSDTPVTGDSLMNAARSMLRGDPAPSNTTPSVGCGIKWARD